MKNFSLKKLVLPALLAVIALFVSAREPNTGLIMGKVADSATTGAIEYATITIYQEGSKKALNGTTSDSSGRFVLSGIGEGNYSLMVEFIGYQPKSINGLTVVKKGSPVDLKTIFLLKSHIALQDVVVTAPKALIENRIDKMIFNAEKDLTSQAGVATDMLKKIPQVSVDVDGNVQLAGSAGIRCLINGKPSSAFGSNIADVLQSIPASQIKSVEVVTNPGAKYDAQGLGGIINIILKQSRVRGINGSLALTAGTRMENGSLNLNARKGNLGVNAFVSGNARLNATTLSSSARSSYDSSTLSNAVLNQDGTYQVKKQGYQSGLGFDWTYKKKNNFSGSVNYNNFSNTGNGAVSQLQVKSIAANGNVLSNVASVNNTGSESKFHSLDASFNYKRTFDKEDKELEFTVNTSSGNGRSIATGYQQLLPQNTIISGNNSTNPAKNRETEYKLDYTEPFKNNVIVGAGAKLTTASINTSSDVLSLKPSAGLYLPDNFLSNYLNYKQKVYAVYAEIGFPVYKLFEAKVGGRYERTEIRSFYSNAQQQVNTPGYNTFVPSVYLLRKLDENKSVKLSYSKRIERPDYEDLNPFINTSDTKNLTAGNPYLLPEIGHRIELSYNQNFDKLGSFMVTAFYRINEQDIQPFIVFYPTFKVGDSTFTNVTVTMRRNIGSERNAGLSLFGDLRVTSKLNLRTNIFVFHRHTINAIDKGYNSNSYNYRFNLNASYEFSKTLAAEFFGNFNSARNEAQGRYPSFTSYSFACRKQFWNRNGSLALIATNPFSKYVDQRTALFGPNFNTSSNRQVPFRSIGLSFTYKFGKLEFKKEKEGIIGNVEGPAM